MADAQVVPRWILHSMSRQIDTIYDEMDQWYEKRRDELKAHARQIERVKSWTKKLALEDGLEQMLAPAVQRDFLEKVFELQMLISSAREVWEFYRDRFELYYSPLERYKKWIEGAEWVAADCYQTAVRNAKKAGLVIDVERWESPLLQLSTENAQQLSTPVTRARGTRIARGSQSYPTSIIVLPVDLMANSWGFLAIHHEVGHDIDADVAAVIDAGRGKIRTITNDIMYDKECATGVCKVLEEKGVPSARLGTWTAWVSEMFADFFAVLSAGPAFVGHMIDALALPREKAFKQQYASPWTYPSPYLRVHILIRFIETMDNAYEQIASTYRSRWDGMYVPGKDESTTFTEYLSSSGIVPENVDGYLSPDFSDIDHFIEAVVDTPFYRGSDGKEVTLRDLSAYTPEDHCKVMDVVEYDLTRPGSTGIKEKIKPRLVPSAARFAFERFTSAESFGDPAKTLEQLNGHALEAIEKNRPSTVLVEEGEERREKRLEERARRFRQQVLRTLEIG